MDHVELHDEDHYDAYGVDRPVDLRDLAQCGYCRRVWCYTCHPTPAARCPFEYDHTDDPTDEPCAACGAEPGEDCRPGCLGYALAHGDLA